MSKASAVSSVLNSRMPRFSPLCERFYPLESVTILVVWTSSFLLFRRCLMPRGADMILYCATAGLSFDCLLNELIRFIVSTSLSDFFGLKSGDAPCFFVAWSRMSVMIACSGMPRRIIAISLSEMRLLPARSNSWNIFLSMSFLSYPLYAAEIRTTYSNFSTVETYIERSGMLHR